MRVELEEDDCILERLLDTLWRSLTEVVRWKGVGRLLGRGRGRSSRQAGSVSVLIAGVLLQAFPAFKLRGALLADDPGLAVWCRWSWTQRAREGRRHANSPGCCCCCCCCSGKKRCDLEARFDFQKEGMGTWDQRSVVPLAPSLAADGGQTLGSVGLSLPVDLLSRSADALTQSPRRMQTWTNTSWKGVGCTSGIEVQQYVVCTSHASAPGLAG